MPISSEVLQFDHSILSNNFPTGGKIQDFHKIAQAQEIDVEHFGLFNTSAPDFNKYYPALDPADLEPKEEQQVFPLFRALSGVIINKFGPLDFTKRGVLKEAADQGLFMGQTVFANHESFVGNNSGVITEVSFEGSRTYEGVTVPPGVNVRVRIDGKAHPELARAVMSDPPEIHSVSVGVVFEWEQSHPKMGREEFFSKLGTFTEEGELIRRIVTKILLIQELSFVNHGGDPYAKIIKDGQINNPKDSKRRDDIAQQRFDALKFEENMRHYYDYASPISIEDFKDDTFRTIDDNSNSNLNNNTMNEELLNALRTGLNLEAEADQAAVEAALTERLPTLLEAEQQLNTSTQELNTLKEKYPEGTVILSDDDKAKLNDFEGHKETAEKALRAMKDETVRLYGIVSNNKPDESILKLIQEGSYDTTLAMLNQYKGQVEEKFVATCNDCNSTNVSRASAAAGEGGVITNDPPASGGEGGEGKEELSTAEAVDAVVAGQKKKGSAPSFSASPK